MLNYVIATYNGNKLEYTLQNQLQILYTLVMRNKLKYLTQITIVCPPTKDKHTPFKFYYQKDHWQSLFDQTKIKLVYIDYIGENDNASYDQWLQAYFAFPDFDYYIFMEDDYAPHPSLTNFDSQLVEFYEKTLDETKIGYLCSFASKLYGFPHHAAISNGIINNKTLKSLGENVLDEFYTLAKTTHCQIAFSKLFTMKEIDILSMHNDFAAWFWCSGYNKLTNYSNDSVTKFMFIPMQYLVSFYFTKSKPPTPSPTPSSKPPTPPTIPSANSSVPPPPVSNKSTSFSTNTPARYIYGKSRYR